MSEQQAEYDTDDPQPTPGPWQVTHEPEVDETDIRVCRVVDGDCVCCVGLMGNYDYDNEQWTEETLREWFSNARLIAAAGTAASELPGWYDPVEAVKALPEIIQAAEKMSSADVTGQIDKALRTARGDNNE